MITKEEEEEIYNEYISILEEEKEQWDKIKSEMNSLIHEKYFDFIEDHDTYRNEGIYEIKLTDEKKSGYPNYQCCRIDGDSLLYMHHKSYLETLNEESKYEGEEIEYYVWQTSGYCGDDYSGFLLIPLSDGRFWKVSYSC
jgi:hypothetical protein